MRKMVKHSRMTSAPVNMNVKSELLSPNYGTANNSEFSSQNGSHSDLSRDFPQEDVPNQAGHVGPERQRRHQRSKSHGYTVIAKPKRSSMNRQSSTNQSRQNLDQNANNPQ